MVRLKRHVRGKGPVAVITDNGRADGFSIAINGDLKAGRIHLLNTSERRSQVVSVAKLADVALVQALVIGGKINACHAGFGRGGNKAAAAVDRQLCEQRFIKSGINRVRHSVRYPYKEGIKLSRAATKKRQG
ncbi:hypothetical protein RABR111495_25105 [Rahnella bruchi]